MAAQKILVVEDDVLNGMFYIAVLRREGFDVAVINDGALVMDEVARFEPDLITMDIHLPHISGLTLIRKLQRGETSWAIPILALTAYAGKGDETEIREAGARGYLAKPIKIPQLLGEVKRLLGEPVEASAMPAPRPRLRRQS